MELVVPAGQDMATKEHTLRILLLTQISIHLGIIGLYFTG